MLGGCEGIIDDLIGIRMVLKKEAVLGQKQVMFEKMQCG